MVNRKGKFNKEKKLLREMYNEGLKIGKDSERLYWERNIEEIVRQKVNKEILNLADKVLKTISDSIECIMKEENKK